MRYDVETGELTATLFEEKSDKYVEPQDPIIFLPWDSSKFIYQSQKDGFSHLYLYDTNGRQIRQLTEGDWLVKEVLGFDTNYCQHRVLAIAEQPVPPGYKNRNTYSPGQCRRRTQRPVEPFGTLPD